MKNEADQEVDHNVVYEVGYEKNEVIVGIDLGTTYSCVAVVLGDEVKIMHNHQNGRNIMPSCVQFTENSRIVGDLAKESLDIYNVVYDSKRMIGRLFNDPEIQEDLDKWTFKVIKRENNPMIEVTKGKNKEHPPETISALILEELKKTAEEFLGQKVTSAVITVPARFNMSQKQATIDAAKIAGLEVKRLIMEPTAAAIDYANKMKLEGKRHILVYDLGGGTFDVSVVKIDGNDIEVLATGGDTHLGGEDFDNSLVDYFYNKLTKIEKVVPENDHKKKIVFRRLKIECEKAKHRLSTAETADLSFPSLCNERDFQESITRQRFEIMNEKLFKKTIEIVKSTLEDCKILPHEIDDVILIGGSTRIPKIKQILQDLFIGKTLNKQIQPDEAVAHGAAIFAQKLKKNNNNVLLKKLNLKDIIPFSIGTSNNHGKMCVGIERSTVFPITKTDIRITVLDNQSNMYFPIYEGERIIAADNKLIGEFTLKNIQKKLAGEVEVELIYKIDENGILDITAKEKSTLNESNLRIAFNTVGMNANQMKEVLAQAERYREDDLKKADLMKAKKDLEYFCYNMISRAEGSDFQIEKKEHQTILKKCKETLEWMDEKNDIETDDYIDQLSILRIICKRLIVK